MARTLPPVSAIKKLQSFFKPWCKRCYALAYAPAGKPPKREGTEYPDLVCGLSPVLSAKPSPVSPEWPRCRAVGKNIHLTVPFCVGDSHPVSLCRLSPTVFRMLYSLQALLWTFSHNLSTLLIQNVKVGRFFIKNHFCKVILVDFGLKL